MSNDVTGTPDPNHRPAENTPATPAVHPYGTPAAENTPAAPAVHPYGTPAAPTGFDTDSDLPEIDEHDPLIRRDSTGTGSAQQDQPTSAHPAITPTPMPYTGGGSLSPTPMPYGNGGQLPPRPMPQQHPAGGYHQGYQAWSPQPTSGWTTGQSSYTVPPAPNQAPPVALQSKDASRKRRGAALVAATVVLALAAGFGGGFLGADVKQNSSGSALTASTVSHSLTQQSSATSTAAAAGTVESVAAAVLPSVVSVVATSQSSAGEGSGVILTEDGYILTNNHVVTGASDLSVRFNDGSTAKATLVGADVTGDIAVIKVDGVSGLTPATLGTSSQVNVGEEVVAIGSPLGLSATVTSGIVSALNRPVRTSSADSQQQQQNPFDQQQGQTSTTTSSGTVLNAIQTDAAINPGNSGGALVNMQGEIIGINSAIASLSSGSSESGSIGVGFAIPIDTASRIAQEIIDTGTATHAILGASVGDATNGNSVITTGATVKSLTSGGPAETAGLQVGDVVTKIGDNLIESADSLVATIRSAAPGSQVTLTVVRGSSTETVNVTLGSASN